MIFLSSEDLHQFLALALCSPPPLPACNPKQANASLFISTWPGWSPTYSCQQMRIWQILSEGASQLGPAASQQWETAFEHQSQLQAPKAGPGVSPLYLLGDSGICETSVVVVQRRAQGSLKLPILPRSGYQLVYKHHERSVCSGAGEPDRHQGKLCRGDQP